MAPRTKKLGHARLNLQITEIEWVTWRHFGSTTSRTWTSIVERACDKSILHVPLAPLFSPKNVQAIDCNPEEFQTRSFNCSPSFSFPLSVCHFTAFLVAPPDAIPSLFPLFFSATLKFQRARVSPLQPATRFPRRRYDGTRRDGGKVETVQVGGSYAQWEKREPSHVPEVAKKDWRAPSRAAFLMKLDRRVRCVYIKNSRAASPGPAGAHRARGITFRGNLFGPTVTRPFKLLIKCCILNRVQGDGALCWLNIVLFAAA